jgi:Tol biopolymer transport system component
VVTQGLREDLRRTDPEINRLSITLPDSIPLAYVGEAWQGIALPALDLSPDGKTLVYVGQVGESTKLFVRRLDSFEVTALEGTDGALNPNFSPTGEWISFSADGHLHRVSLNGDRPITITEANQPYGSSWNDRGQIVSIIQDSRTLLLTGLTGADSEYLPIGPAMGNYFSSPRWVPGSDWILGTCYSPNRLCTISSGTLEVQLLMEQARAGDPEGTPLEGANPRFIEPGFLVFGDPIVNQVMAARFDPDRLAVLSDPVEMFRGIRREASHGALQMAVSASGDMVYAPGEDSFKGHLVWAAPGGVRDTLPFGPELYGPFYLSPDGRRVVALLTSELGEYEIWFLDLEREERTPWTPNRRENPGTPYYGGWLPDSRHSVATLVQGDSCELVLLDALDPTESTTLWRGEGMVAGNSFYEDGTGLFTVYGSGSGSYPSLVALADLPNLPANALEAFPDILERAGGEAFPSLSPNREWMIYNSDPQGHWELYAWPFGSDAPPEKISPEGADIGLWTRSGDRLYFRNGQSFYWVEETGDPRNPFSDPEFYLEGNFLNVSGPELAVHPDGKRLLLLEGPSVNTTTELRFVQNWTQVLRDRLGGGG